MACSQQVDEPRHVTVFPVGSRILAVGEGDFAFSEALANAGHTKGGGELVATSLDEEAEVFSKYACGAERLSKLRSIGAEVMCGIDARRLHEGPLAGREAFDRILFNFPLLPVTAIQGHAGQYDVHLANRALLVDFLRSAQHVLRPNGAVVIASKDCFPYSWWRIEALPQWSGGDLAFAGMLPWRYTEYPTLYAGPCNVNRDAAVKPTDAVVYVFARAGSASFAHFNAHLVNADWNHAKGRARVTPGLGNLCCEICCVDGLSAQDLAQHEAGKIHRKRAALEERWRQGRGSGLPKSTRAGSCVRRQSPLARIVALLLLPLAAAAAFGALGRSAGVAARSAQATAGLQTSP